MTSKNSRLHLVPTWAAISEVCFRRGLGDGQFAKIRLILELNGPIIVADKEILLWQSFVLAQGQTGDGNEAIFGHPSQ